MRRWWSLLDLVGWRRSPPVQGSLDGVFDGMVCGWAWMPGSPAERVGVTLKVGDSARTVVADRFRADLADLGKGDGRCGFAIPLRLFGVEAPDAEIEALVGGRRLPGSPRPCRPDDRISIGKDDLVGLAFRALLGRDPHPDDLAFHTRTLRDAASIETLLLSLVESEEFRTGPRGGRRADDAPPQGVDAAIAALAERLPAETQRLLRPAGPQAGTGRLSDRTARSLLRTAALLAPDGTSQAEASGKPVL